MNPHPSFSSCIACSRFRVGSTMWCVAIGVGNCRMGRGMRTPEGSNRKHDSRLHEFRCWDPGFVGIPCGACVSIVVCSASRSSFALAPRLLLPIDCAVTRVNAMVKTGGLWDTDVRGCCPSNLLQAIMFAACYMCSKFVPGCFSLKVHALSTFSRASGFGAFMAQFGSVRRKIRHDTVRLHSTPRKASF